MKIYLGGARDPLHDQMVIRLTNRRLFSFWSYFKESGSFYSLTHRIALVIEESMKIK